MESDHSEAALIEARVLVVDDDPIQLALIKKLSSRIVTEVQGATDGVEGLALWHQWRPQVVITDIFMPRMSGLEMSSAIMAEDNEAQIVVMTSEKAGESLLQALAIGVERYLSKPIDMNLLGDAIRKCIRDQQKIEELNWSRQVATLTKTLQEQLQEKQIAEDALQKEKQEHLVLISRLEEAHNQLLQSEKMASIGQLAAGVAHEINNPVGFVNSNLGALQTYVQSLLKLLSAYEQHESSLTKEGLQTITQIKNEIDLAYLRQDVESLLAESLGGLQRVKQIVQNLKDFSHAGDAEVLWSSIEAGLESTLSVVWNELKYKAEVIRDYGVLPEIECIPSQLNQVFMNLLVNAAQAISERGKITLRTRQDGENICVEISDTGSGIPPEILNRIFDPFFTTKPVGSGTGLGLSISHGIVRKHNGRIEVDSEPGKGTCFRIILPIRQPAGSDVSGT